MTANGLDQNMAAALRERDPFLFPQGNPNGSHFVLPRVGCPGTVTLFGPFVIPLVVVSASGKPDEPHKAIAAASCLGRGRVVAIAHEGYLTSNDPAVAAFVNLCYAWLGGVRNTIKVIDESNVDQARAHVEAGGGCLVASCPWGWGQLNPTRKLSDYKLNALLAPAGMCFAGDTAPGSGPITVNITRECTSALLSSMLSANLIPKTTLANLALALDPSKQVSQAHLPYPPNTEHLVGTFPPGDQANARAAYGAGGWWAPVCETPALEFDFKELRDISGVEAFCVNVEACPKEISLYASRDGQQWDLLATFPFRTYNSPDGKTNVAQTFVLTTPVRIQYAKVQFKGIHKSYYVGINIVTFLHTSLVVPPTGSAVSSASLEAMPSAYRQIMAKELLASLNAGFNAPCAKEAVLRDSANGNTCIVMSTVSKYVQVALPRAAEFPGSCGATLGSVASGRAATAAQVNVRALGHERGWWYFMRRYADPNSPITITPLLLPHPNGATDYTTSWRLRIGCHSDNLEACEKFHRWPDVCEVMDLPRVGTAFTIYPRFGGLLYLEAATNVPPHHAAFAMEIQGSWSAPYYSKETGYVAGDAPWGEVEGEKVILSLPSHAIQEAEARGDLPSASSFWDSVVRHHHQLATPPYGARKERIVADVQISCGYMHSGYPIMCHLDFADRALDVMKMMTEGDWGMFHELGHNMQRDWWTWNHTTEVTVNLFTLYTMKDFLGKDLNAFDNLWGREGRGNVVKWVQSGKPRQTWNENPFLALYMYAQLTSVFGWEALKAVMRRYEVTESLRPPHDASGDAKLQRWAEVYSNVIGRNLAPFFVDWGFAVHPTPEMASLPAWRCDIPS